MKIIKIWIRYIIARLMCRLGYANKSTCMNLNYDEISIIKKRMYIIHRWNKNQYGEGEGWENVSVNGIPVPPQDYSKLRMYDPWNVKKVDNSNESQSIAYLTPLSKKASTKLGLEMGMGMYDNSFDPLLGTMVIWWNPDRC